MKRKFGKFFLASTLMFLPSLLLSSCGNNEEIVDSNKETFSVTTQFDQTKGSVTLDKEKGEVGEKVNVTITPLEEFELGEIKFNGETLQTATTLSLSPKKGANTLEVTFKQKLIQSNKYLIATGPTKTEYRVGEALDLTGLEVKLVVDDKVEEATIYTKYETSIKNGYVFTENDIINEGNIISIVIYSNETDDDITSTNIEVTLKPEEVQEVAMTPADFLKKMKETESYKVENAETTGIYIKNANYWTAKKSTFDTYGYAQNDSKIICYTLNNGKYLESQYYSRTSEDLNYTSMYDDGFAKYLTDLEIDRYCRGIGYISDKQIEQYRKKLKPSEMNPNEYLVNVSSSATSTFARDLIQLTYNGPLVLNDYGIINTMGYNAKIKLTILSETEMQISLLNTSTARYWPVETKITLDNTLTIPELDNFLNNKEEDDPYLGKTKAAFSLIRQGNFTVDVYDVFTKNYRYWHDKRQADFIMSEGFTYDNQLNEAGSYTVTFNDDFSVGKFAPYPGYGIYDITSNPMLNMDETYLPYFDESTKTLKLSYYAMKDTPEYNTEIPKFYAALKNINLNTVETYPYYDNIHFTIHYSDDECKDIQFITIEFARIGQETVEVELSRFGTSKENHVDAFINTLTTK